MSMWCVLEELDKIIKKIDEEVVEFKKEYAEGYNKDFSRRQVVLRREIAIELTRIISKYDDDEGIRDLGDMSRSGC